MITALAPNAAAEINQLHADICGMGRKTVEMVIRIGELLTGEKAKLQHGEWLPWVRENLEFSERTSRNYISVYQRRDTLKTANVADLSDAYKLLAAPAGDTPEDVEFTPEPAAPTFDRLLAEADRDDILRAARVIRDEERTERRAAVIAELERRELEPLDGKGKYRVIYADPPWPYRHDLGEAMPGSTSPRDHYTVMDMDGICALPVGTLAEDNAVLFMWGTVPLLPEALRVIDAWGFQYKSHVVWDKVKHNFGHYFSVRHELLFLATRGSCTPEVPKLTDSVVSLEKTARHSEKPDQFRELIDTLYPHGRRIELFRRGAAVGKWDVWGNEVAE
ncbi:MAG: MT-A70 family methyltransferase [Verrucomicrobiia bacterium]